MWNLSNIKMLHSLAHHMTWHLSQWPWLSHGGTFGGIIGLQSHLKWLVYHPMNPFYPPKENFIWNGDGSKFAIVKHAEIVHNHVLLQKNFPHLKLALFWNTKNSYTNEKEKNTKQFGWKIICEKKFRRKLYKRTFYKNFTDAWCHSSCQNLSNLSLFSHDLCNQNLGIFKTCYLTFLV